MGGYNFNVAPVQVEGGADYQARRDAAKARKIELQQRQIQLDQLKKAQADQATQSAAAASAYQPQSYTPQAGSINVGGANLGYQPAQVQGPTAFNKGSYLQALPPDQRMQAEQQFQQQDFEHQKQMATLTEALGKASGEQLKNLGTALDLQGRYFNAVDSAPPQLQPQIYAQARQHAIQAGVPGAEQTPEQFDPQAWQAMKSQFMDVKQAADLANKNSELRSKTVQTAAGVQQFNPATNQYDQNIGKLPKTVAPGINLSIAGGGAGTFSDAALGQAAEQYATTGQMPSLGMGKASSALRVKVANRAAELHPVNNLALNKGTYAADQGSLKTVQKSLDSVSAFESTAGKNLDQFLATAAKVPDTGVPWLNAPLRSVNANGLGSADQAAFNAARQVALTEISKVVNNPNLTGTLSDSARNEVMALNPESATFAQIKKVAQVLKTDMANRRTALTATRDEIKGRIGGQSGNQTQSGGDPFSQFGGTLK